MSRLTIFVKGEKTSTQVTTEDPIAKPLPLVLNLQLHQ